MTNRTDIIPRLMPAPVAAAYLGVSESTLRTLSIPRKALGCKRLYERADLDAYADSLPYVESVPAPGSLDEGTECADRIFGQAH